MPGRSKANASRRVARPVRKEEEVANIQSHILSGSTRPLDLDGKTLSCPTPWLKLLDDAASPKTTVIGLPLSELDACRIIAASEEFEERRFKPQENVWTLPRTRFDLGPAFLSHVHDLRHQAWAELHSGDPSEITVEEQGLLLLGPGPVAEMPGFRSSNNHCATFVVSLPSLHEGGNLVLGKTRVHKLIDHSYAAYFLGRDAHFTAIDEGYRLFLVYDLVWNLGEHVYAPEQQHADLAEMRVRPGQTMSLEQFRKFDDLIVKYGFEAVRPRLEEALRPMKSPSMIEKALASLSNASATCEDDIEAWTKEKILQAFEPGNKITRVDTPLLMSMIRRGPSGHGEDHAQLLAQMVCARLAFLEMDTFWTLDALSQLCQRCSLIPLPVGDIADSLDLVIQYIISSFDIRPRHGNEWPDFGKTLAEVCAILIRQHSSTAATLMIEIASSASKVNMDDFPSTILAFLKHVLPTILSIDPNLMDRFHKVLFQECIYQYIARFVQPLPQERLPHPAISCTMNCDDCAELNSFLVDPSEKVEVFLVNEKRRQHLVRSIAQTTCTYEVIRFHRPYQLVVHKPRQIASDWLVKRSDRISLANRDIFDIIPIADLHRVLGEARFEELLHMKITDTSPMGLLFTARDEDIAYGQRRLEQDPAWAMHQRSVRSIMNNRAPAQATASTLQPRTGNASTMRPIVGVKRERDEAD